MSENTTNPYNKTSQEAEYQTYEHGFNSRDKSECPYDDGMLEYDTYYPVWMQGYNAGKVARKGQEKAAPAAEPKAETKKGPGRPKSSPTAPQSTDATLTEEFLMAKLKELKRPRYEELKAELAKLEWLFGDENV